MAREVFITRPCTEAPGKYAAASSLDRKVDMDRLCVLIKDIKDGKCSASLGVAKFDWEDRTYIVYRSGRVDLRKVSNVEEAGKAMDALESLIGDALYPAGR